jgi:hypothetical protein
MAGAAAAHNLHLDGIAESADLIQSVAYTLGLWPAASTSAAGMLMPGQAHWLEADMHCALAAHCHEFLLHLADATHLGVCTCARYAPS